ncbi:MAG: hypothetical protein HFE86_00320 [Clostridiales bacterium]|nr:hypothetical protein [Clostridiales bacterium]
MSRYTNTLATNLDPQEVEAIVQQYMQSEGFSLMQYSQQEQAWKKGAGFLTYPQYMKVTPAPGSITVEAFLKFPLFPGVYVGELHLNGFVAAPIKSVLKGRVSRLEQMLQQAAYNKGQAMQGQQPAAR